MKILLGALHPRLTTYPHVKMLWTPTMTNKCTNCQVTKSADQFTPVKAAKTGLSSWCKRCRRETYRAQNRERMRGYANPTRIANQLWVTAYKATVGCDCGENDPDCLDLHHRDPSKKSGQVSCFIHNRSQLEAEVKKCVVICANCHRKKHARDRRERSQRTITIDVGARFT